jgi:starch phosphorylase
MRHKNGAPFAPMTRSRPNAKLTEMTPLGMDPESIAEDFRHYFSHTLGRDKNCNNIHYPYKALSMAVRNRLMERWKNTQYAYEEANCRRTHYLSLEFLMGRALGNSMLNLGITDEATKGLYDMGLVLEEIAESEHDAGLGNGGLGRLAACFLDSCATLQLPVKGYGLRYEYGMFRQEIENGHQVEEPDHWLRDGNPWEMERPEYTQRVHFGGRTEHSNNGNGESRGRWVETHDVLAVPYDTPVPGFRNRRTHHHGALPQRRQRERQGAAPAPAVFPRLRQPAGCVPRLETVARG